MNNDAIAPKTSWDIANEFCPGTEARLLPLECVISGIGGRQEDMVMVRAVSAHWCCLFG